MANMFINAMTDVWNSVGTTFTAIKMSVNDTASAAGSKLIDLRGGATGSTSLFSVDKSGNTIVAGTLTATGAIAGPVGTSSRSAGLFTTLGANGAVTFSSGGSLTGAFSPSVNGGATLGTSLLGYAGMNFSLGGFLTWNNPAGTPDVSITHGSDLLTVSGGDLRISTNFTTSTSVTTNGGTQTLTNKTLTSPTINGATLSGALIGDIILDGGVECSGSLTALSTLEVLGAATFDGEVNFGTRFAHTAGAVGVSYFGAATVPYFAVAANGIAPIYINRSDASTANLTCLALDRNGVTLNAILATPTVVTFSTSSDYRMKENVVEMAGALERLAALRPVNFTWINDPGAGIADGFIAHEVQAIVPTAVNGEKDGEDMQGIDLSKLVPLLVGSSQELLAMVNGLTARIAELEGKV